MNLFILISKYLNIFLIIMYTILSYSVLAVKSGKGKSIISGFENAITVLLLLNSFIHLSFISGLSFYLIYCGFVSVFVMLLVFLTTIIYKNSDRLILNNMSFLLSVGLIMISRISISKAIKQYIIILIAFIICLVIPVIIIRMKDLRKYKWVYGGIGIALLLIVMFIGQVTNGSKLSITIWKVSFQPSEFSKVLFVIFIAAMLWNNKKFVNILLTSLIAALYVGILVFSKDLGSALIFFIAYLFILVIAAENYLYMLAGMLLGGGFSVVAYHLFSHVRRRVVAWKDPWTYIDTSGYQITQGLFALTSGGVWGTGLMKGTPSDIPYVETDFIFAAICEEMGLIFGICILLIYISTFIEFVRLATRMEDMFFRLIVFGLGVSITFQVFLTVGGGTKFIPLTGVTLPFISYGGSSVMSTMIMLFIVQGIYIREKRNEE